MSAISNGRYVVISSDGHAGADLRDYRDFLESRYHDEFDAWAAAYENPWGDLVVPDADRNWDTARRLKELESDGIVAEVLFPNTIPPFFPSGNLVARPPAPAEYELRWAGLRAHNRWMAAFCAEAPGRRAGMAQIFLHDVDAAVKEIEWAAGAGLFGGVLLPGVPPDSGLPPLIAPVYEPIWAACEDLGMPLNNHSGTSGPDFGPYEASTALWMIELGWFSHRVFWHLVFAKVFARHPGLKLVLTEQSAGWVPAVLDMLDHTYDRFRTPGAAESHFGGTLVAGMDVPPSAYWARNCFAGASFFRPCEAEVRHRIGVDKIMWGADYPHSEGTYPHTREALRHTFAGIDPVEVAAMVGGNAARVYGFDLGALGALAAEVGPTVEEVAVPLDAIPLGTTSKAFEAANIKPW